MIGPRLTMRAEIERDVASGTDNWGQPNAPDFQPHCTLPCFAYTPNSREVFDGDKVASIQDVRIMFALGVDVNEADEIAEIRRPGGEVLFIGRFRIDGPVQFKHNHLEAPLRKVS
jgi:hypothetical protein